MKENRVKRQLRALEQNQQRLEERVAQRERAEEEERQRIEAQQRAAAAAEQRRKDEARLAAEKAAFEKARAEHFASMRAGPKSPSPSAPRKGYEGFSYRKMKDGSVVVLKGGQLLRFKSEAEAEAYISSVLSGGEHATGSPAPAPGS